MSEATSDTVRFLEDNAFQYYTEKADGRWTFRNYLPQCLLEEMAGILERPLSLGELQLLVGEDGEPTTCCVTEETFQPVWWKGIGQYCGETRRFSLWSSFAYELVRHPTVGSALVALEGRILTFGCFYVRTEDIIAFSGPSVWFDAKTSRYLLPTHSPLAKAKGAHPDGHWGKCSEEVRVIEESRARRQKEQEKVHDLMAGVVTHRR